MKKHRLFISLVLILLLSACYDLEYREGSYRNSGSLNIYLVKDGQVSRSSWEVSLHSLELEGTPWISQREIDFYDWSAHTFFLKEEKPKEKYSGRYFLVKSDDEPLFLGYFFPPYMSSLPPYPAVIATDYYFYPMDVVSMDGFGGYYNDTMDENIRFRKALINTGLLKEGISVELTGLKKKNSSTVVYTYKVTNLDKEVIYVLDPDKMGASRFHYYTNGVSFVKNNTYYFTEDLENTPSNKILSDWYYHLQPGRTVTRSVELAGFRALPTGTFTVRFTFPGANSLEAGMWKVRDGRIWLGQTRTEKDFYF